MPSPNTPRGVGEIHTGDSTARRFLSKQALAEWLLENPTWPERILWSRLRRGQIGYHFQRQASVRGFLVDFWCPVARVVIELDGPVHALPEKIASDARRDRIFGKAKIACLRFDNSDVYHGMSAVLIRIWEHCFERAPYPLKPFPKEAESSSSFEETVEMRALRSIQEANRLKQHEDRFIHCFRKNRWYDRGRKRHA